MRIKTIAICAALAFTTLLSASPLDTVSGEIKQYDRSADLYIPDEATPALPDKRKLLAAGPAENDETMPVSAFRVSNLSPTVTTDLDYTDWWHSEWDNCWYVFLPATADRSNLVITYSADKTVYLNGESIVSGKTTAILSKSDTFEIKVGTEICGTLKVMQSNLGSIYLSTSHGGLKPLDENRYLTETGKILILDNTGKTQYSGELDKLTSRGNSSWDYSVKKPYNFKLPKKADLFGMGKAKKWALLSNYIDHSMLRNKLTQEMCREAGMEYIMDSVFVDLYADGAYRGTYQLSERVQIQKNRINIRDLEEETEELNSSDLEKYQQKVVGTKYATDYMENSYKYYDIPNDPDDITGGYLLQFQQWNRYGTKCQSGFITSRGQSVDIDGPEYASKAQAEYIRSFVQDAEDAVYSQNGVNSKGRHYSDYIDVESLIKAYLVQEISENIDGTSSSFYLWKDSDKTGDGKLHFSPAWDFDLSYNNFPSARKNSDGNIGFSYRPDNLFIAYFPIHGYDDGGISSSTGSGRPTVGISWIGQLYKNDDFVKQVGEVYFDDFEPFLNKLTDSYMTTLAESIRPSADMNNAMWHMYGGPKYSVFNAATSGGNSMESAELVRQYIEKREVWLSNLWQPYCPFVRGDVNADGNLTVADAVKLQKWLLTVPDTKLEKWQAADLCKDGKLDIYDLTLMKTELKA